MIVGSEGFGQFNPPWEIPAARTPFDVSLLKPSQPWYQSQVTGEIFSAGTWLIGQIFPNRTVDPSVITKPSYMPYVVGIGGAVLLLLVIAGGLMGKNT